MLRVDVLIALAAAVRRVPAARRGPTTCWAGRWQACVSARAAASSLAPEGTKW